jgi:sulfatase-like protein
MPNDVLVSWNDGAAKRAVVDFVAQVTKEGTPDFVPPAARIAVFDNDGSLWCEKPLPIQANISAYSHGVVGYKTPNLDRIAKEGMMFTDYYAENSCTAGRSSFITGQTPKRTGLSKVGIPGAPIGLQARDVTIAQALKPLGYATGQFGKNHLGDRNEFLPTVHGFDEFFGNLYHSTPRRNPNARIGRRTTKNIPA